MIDLKKLEELARAATPGPWFYQEDSDAYTHIVRAASQPNLIVASGCQTSDETGESTGRFIGAANPAAVLEMIDLIRKQETALTEIQGRMGGLLVSQAGLVEALSAARNGLVWYQETFPEAVDGSDDEALQQIDEALAAAGVAL